MIATTLQFEVACKRQNTNICNIYKHAIWQKKLFVFFYWYDISLLQNEIFASWYKVDNVIHQHKEIMFNDAW